MQKQPSCLFCGKTSAEVPLVNLIYKGQPAWICADHLPMLIHDRQKLAAQLDKAAGRE